MKVGLGILLIVCLLIPLAGCGILEIPLKEDRLKKIKNSESYLKGNAISVEEAENLLVPFEKAFPDSDPVDDLLVDIDNDGLNELLIALNDYSGANEKQNLELAKNKLVWLYLGLVFPKGNNSSEDITVLGKTFEKGTRFVGDDLFSVVKKNGKLDHVKVRAVTLEGGEVYFPVKIELDEDGLRTVK